MRKHYKMRTHTLIIVFLTTLMGYAQETEEFIPTLIDDKEAFMSTKTGEFVFREHQDTDPNALRTNSNGDVIYTETKIHKVKAGESLYVVAKKNSSSVDKLRKDNNLKNNNLKIGQEIKIVNTYAVASSKPVISQGESKIIARLAPGQSLDGVPDLPPDAMPGSTINLVSENSEDSPETKVVNNIIKEDITKDISEDGTITHTVKGGETLFAIARKYKVSIDDVKKENNLALNTISAGQKLKIKVYNAAVYNQEQEPVVVDEAKSEVEEKVVDQKTEVVEEDPSKEAASVNEEVVEETQTTIEPSTKKVLKETSSKKIEISEEKAAMDAAKEERTKALIDKYKKNDRHATATKDESEKPSVYIVRKGDTLWSIAKRHHISIKDLKDINKLESNVLSVGQKLKLK